MRAWKRLAAAPLAASVTTSLQAVGVRAREQMRTAAVPRPNENRPPPFPANAAANSAAFATHPPAGRIHGSTFAREFYTARVRVDEKGTDWMCGLASIRRPFRPSGCFEALRNCQHVTVPPHQPGSSQARKSCQ